MQHAVIPPPNPSTSTVLLVFICISDFTFCGFQVDMNFMKKIPPGAEASNVLVGEVDFLEKPIIAFVRLSPAVLITGLTEVPVPTRYSNLKHLPLTSRIRYLIKKQQF